MCSCICGEKGIYKLYYVKMWLQLVSIVSNLELSCMLLYDRMKYWIYKPFMNIYIIVQAKQA
ncbi:hypothetical protein XENTR_v10024109 [Xenopus tropicalis]|nr:hypothetical protein XENTR_v10024109 [Xenopus tropicalis]